MCLRDTYGRFRTDSAHDESRLASRLGRIIAISIGCLLCANAQTGPGWKRIGGTSISEGLAGLASGPVTSVWYAPGTGALLAETESSRIYETTDFVHWRLNSTPPAPAGNAGFAPFPAPEAGAKVEAAGPRLYAAGPSNVYASEDNGRTWLNLTGFNNRSVIGNGFTGLAIAPGNPLEISAANQFGVWRSLDGGLSWQSLNEDLPNLMVRKLIDRRTVMLADGTVAAVNAGAWTPLAANDPELALRARFSRAAHADVSAAASSGTTAYAGTSSGQLLVSHDGGSTWNRTSQVAGSGISRIWVDGDRPDVALAAAGGKLFRTVNGGLFWDDVTGGLPPGQIHGITADRSAGVVYVATDSGVFSGRLSLNDAGPGATNWNAVSRDLPAAPAWDVRLNPDNTITVALDGYGVFEKIAPNAMRNIRIVSGADMTDRPAAPGSLISVLGAKVDTVTAQGLSYPVLASSTQSSQVQVPFEAPVGTSSLSLASATNRWSIPLTVKDTSPAIFVDEQGAPLILDAASGLVVDPKVAVYAGSTLQILATGLGKVDPQWPTGVPAPVDSPPAVRGTVTAFLDGHQIEVTRAVLAPGYVGYYLVELQIPAIVNRGTSDLRIVMNGLESNPVKLNLEPNLPGTSLPVQ